MNTAWAAQVAGKPVWVKEIDDRETAVRAGNRAAALPRAGTSEGRQLRRWLTQLVTAERVVAEEAAVRGLTADGAPALEAVLPDTSARLQIGSVAAAVLADPLARAVFTEVTAAVRVSESQVAAYHARNPLRFAIAGRGPNGWHTAPVAPALDAVRDQISSHLRAAVRRQAFRQWLDAQCAALVQLAPGYEHPGDPRQPDNTHKH
ncbi:malonyl CoA-ACP transacylase [Mycobacterium sp. E802]|uniref:DUF7158 domain-containing protein n=1 Tax=Mycobacterium sp. E802 TaxID=1834152 RepID=UPI0007FFD283|nr:malonyl CoA-ACP transacylase [Mycobacterium sp. E802]OBG88892.1 malonyl CoA-ACP transacylase [Mycobacterium sp. E802]